MTLRERTAEMRAALLVRVRGAKVEADASERALRVAVVVAVERGVPVTDVARAAGVTRPTVYRWLGEERIAETLRMAEEIARDEAEAIAEAQERMRWDPDALSPGDTLIALDDGTYMITPADGLDGPPKDGGAPC